VLTMTPTTTTDRVAPQLSSRLTLLVVAVSCVIAAIARWIIAGIAAVTADSEHAMLASAFALVIGFMVALGGVGFGLRNRERGGRFTLIFGLVLAAVHVISGLNQGMGILAVPFDPYSTDFSAFLLVPLLYTVPASILRLIAWWWVPVALAAGIAVSNVVFAITVAG